MNFLFSTGSLWSYSVERCFAFARQAGYDGLELMIDRRWETRQPEYLCRLITQHRLPISAVHSPFVPGIPGWPEEPAERLKRAVALAEAVGAEVVVHHPPLRFGLIWAQIGRRFAPIPVPGWRPEAGYKRWLEEAYLAYQDSAPVQLCIENMPARPIRGWRVNPYVWGRHDQIIRFPSITLDTTHLGTWGVEPVEVYPMLRNSIRHVHLSNYDGREHLRPESGHLRLNAFLARLAVDGYDGFVSLELHPEALDAGQPDEAVIAHMSDSLKACRTWSEG